MTSVVVSGAIANKPWNGGDAWVRMSWVRGLRRLGLDVCFVEQLRRADCVDADGRPAPFERSVNRDHFERVLSALGDGCPAALLCDDGTTAGAGAERALDQAREADLLVNVSGHLTVPDVRAGVRASAYIDVDPGFTQAWHADGREAARVEGHDWYFTVGLNVGRPTCPIPVGGLDWRPLPPPVTLADWPPAPAPRPDRFTTVATWRSPLGPLALAGSTLPGKHHEWRRVVDLPRRSPYEYEIALDIHPGDAADRSALLGQGWRLVDPRSVAADPLAFRGYVLGSGAEFSVANGAYVHTRSGWLSDRTVRYLATGRPALVQDTGLDQRHAPGVGLVTFADVDGAVEAAARIVRDHDEHAAAARALAEERFDSDIVLSRFLAEVGLG